MDRKAHTLVNGITFYRLAAAPVLLILLLGKEFSAFKWLLVLSFFTDAIDGWLARRFKVVSLLGARIDSIADDLTVMVAILGILFYQPGFLRSEWLLVGLMALLYIAQNTLALIRYRRLTSFHTYTAKIAAVFQGLFLILFFFLPEPPLTLFYFAAAATIIDLAEETVLVLILPQWQVDVKGLYWVWRSNKNEFPFSPGRMVFYIFSLLVFYLAVHYVAQLKDIRRLLLEMSPVWLMLAVTAQVATYFFNVFILRALLNKKTGTASFITLLKLSVVILFINQVLPTGGLSGNGYVFGQLRKRGFAAQAVFKALVLESLGYYIAFMMLLACFYSWFASTETVKPLMTYTVLTGFIFFIALSGIMFVISNSRAITWAMQKLSRFGRVRAYIESKGLLSLAKAGGTSWIELFKDKMSIAQAVLLQVGILSCDGITIFAIFKGFHVQLPPGEIMLGFLLAQVIGSLPISPGALIAYESAMTFFYTQLGAPLHAALIVTLLFRFFSFWLPIPAGLWLYRDLRRHPL